MHGEAAEGEVGWRPTDDRVMKILSTGGDMKAYHVTRRARALEILAHGFGPQDVAVVTRSLDGVRLIRHPALDTFNPGRFMGGAEDLPPDLKEGLGDPDDWEVDMPPASIHDPIGDTILEVTLDDLVNLDNFRYREAVSLVHRSTHEVRFTDHFIWRGEWLVPLDIVRSAEVWLVEADLTAHDEEFLRHSIATWRAEWQREGVPEPEIERRLSEMEESARKPDFEGGAE